MRHTSNRRRGPGTSGRTGKQYLGAPDGVPKPAETPTYVRDPEDPDAIFCESCKTWVKKTPSGKVGAHAPGGHRTNVVKGRMACPGVPVVAEYVPISRVAPLSVRFVSKADAVKQELATASEVAEKLGLQAATVRHKLAELGVQPVGFVGWAKDRGAYLFPIRDVIAAAPPTWIERLRERNER